jgi:hypothetical protein
LSVGQQKEASGLPIGWADSVSAKKSVMGEMPAKNTLFGHYIFDYFVN